MERRRQEDDELEKRVVDLAVGVIGLKGALEHIGGALADEVHELQDEIATQRKLSKYNRRTHFQMLFWVAFFAIHLSDVANELKERAPILGDFIFWITDDGGGWGWRLLGFLTQMSLFWWLWHRAQVPDELYHRVAAGADDEPGKRSLYNRLLGRAS